MINIYLLYTLLEIFVEISMNNHWCTDLKTINHLIFNKKFKWKIFKKLINICWNFFKQAFIEN